jgi:hypothetical protein
LIALSVAILAWVPFATPLPVWQDTRWPWLIVPLCAGVSIVYKSIKCASMRTVARESLAITLWILLAMGATAVGLAALVRFLER